MADISENQAFVSLINAMQMGREAARTLGLLRGDERWIAVAAIFDRTKDSAEQLFTKSRRQGSVPLVSRGSPIILPHSRGG